MPIRTTVIAVAPLLMAVTSYADTYPRQPGVDAVHYAFRLTIDDSSDRIAGETTITFKLSETERGAERPVHEEPMLGTAAPELIRRARELRQRRADVDGLSTDLYVRAVEQARQSVNTSFNVRGEPIVCTPEDSYRCFMRTEMDALALETCVLNKKEQPEFRESTDWRREFSLD